MASRFLSPAYEVMLSAASPGINFARGLAGYQDPIGTPAMKDRMLELVKLTKGPSRWKQVVAMRYIMAEILEQDKIYSWSATSLFGPSSPYTGSWFS
jgi:hypothetical protein